ncbi:MAG: prolyl oligopeptidase family serine peptidase [Vitreoscilla sp.]
MKTTFLALALLTTAAHAASLTNASASSRPPQEPFNETRYGIALSDPYRWMEQDSRVAEMTTWIKSASDHTVAELATLPPRAQFAATLEKTTRAGVRYSDVQSAGAALFYRRLDPADRVPKLVVRQGGVERILFDPAAGKTQVSAIGNYSLSPDGRTVAVQVSEGGAEAGETRFLDVATGKQVGQALGPIWGEIPVGWLSNQRVTYSRMAEATPGVDPIKNMQVLVTTVGQPGGTIVLGTAAKQGPAFEPEEFPFISTSTLSHWVIGLGLGARSDARVMVARDRDVAAGRPAWREIASYADQVNGSALLGDSLFTLSTKGTPNGAVYRRDLRAGAAAPATVVLPQGDLVLTGISTAIDGLYVSAQRDGVSHLLYLAGGRGKPVEVKLPIEGDMHGLAADQDGRSVLFGLNGWLTDLAFHRVAHGKLQNLRLASATWPGASEFTTVREDAISADGTHVPMVVMLPKGGKTGAPLRTILEGYGSYGEMSVSPWYSPNFLGWLANGGAMAFCGTRGGGERGRDWHEGGRGMNKLAAQADYIACAERLRAAGYASPKTLVATGTSAGGTLVPGAVLRRPDLFAALVSRVAMVDVSRLEAAENGANQYAEFGDARTEAGFQSLVAQDAYLMLPSAATAPDMLITIGLNDKRVAPWMNAKFAAMAANRFGDKSLVLIRADTEAGHGIGSARDRLIAEWADTFAFAWDRTTQP